MTLHELRLAIGDEAFFDVLQQWQATQAGGNGTTGEFIALAEQISGQELGDLFHEWLFTKTKPILSAPVQSASGTARRPSSAALLERLGV